ncbi:hypothetical protein K2P47_04235 [Patescibacteria group bacterium]|nr:hypothetical protein [Patescibacteria group bacterium]
MWILVPLSNDADKFEPQRKYMGVGPNSKQRIAEAVQWAEEKIPTEEKVWVFGAGTHYDWRRGQTLGVWSEAFLRTLLQNPITVIANHHDKNFYGTHEEMKWGVRAVQKEHSPGTVVFVFFGPRWHLLQARVVWRLFFKADWGRARFVETADGAVPSWPHEIKRYLKIVGHWLFPKWVKTQDQTPYPAAVSQFGMRC